MVVCNFYLKGNCKFGDRCRNQHPRNISDYNQSSNSGNNQSYDYSSNYTRGGQQSYYNQQQTYGNYGGQRQNQDQFHWKSGQQQSRGGQNQAGSGKSVSFHSSFGGSNQNQFAALDPGRAGSPQRADGQDLKPNEIIEIIKKDIEEWEATKTWPFSSYKPTRSQHCIPGFEDITQDEMRYAAYTAEKQQKFEQYKAAVASLMTTVQQQKDQLKRPSSNLSSQLVDIFKGIFQAGSSTSLGNGDTMFQTLVIASGGNNSQPTAIATAQQGTSFGTSTTAASTATFGSATPSTSFGSGSFGSTQGSAGATGFGSGLSEKPATSGGIGSAGPPFGSSAGSGLFSKGGSTQSSSQQATGLFGKGGATSIGTSSASGTGLFGKGGVTSTATGLFGKPAAAGGLFSQGQGSAQAVDSNMYTPVNDITLEEKEQFEADVFTIGKIPTRPPPLELVK